jgi:hypothetical protein
VGNFSLSNGSMDLTGSVYLGNVGVANVNISGGTLNHIGFLRAGLNPGSAAHIVQTGGDVSNNEWVELAEGVGSQVDYAMSGGTLTTERDFQIGRRGDGLFHQTGGDVLTRTGWVHIADEATGSGRYLMENGTLRTGDVNLAGNGVGLFDLSGGTVTATGQLNAGFGATGQATYRQSGGSASFATNVLVGTAAGAVATASLSDGALTVGANEVIGVDGQGSMSQSGGVHTINGDLTIAQNPSAVGSYDLAGGYLDMTGGTMSYGFGSASFSMTGGVLHDPAVINFTLNQQGGVLEPGASPGHTTINGDYLLGAPGTLQIELLGAGAPGTLSDLVSVNGLVDLAGALDLVLGFAPNPNDTFLILNNDDVDAVAGTFAGLPEGASVFATFGPDLFEFSISYQALTGNDVVLRAVPEPATWVLLLISAIGLLTLHRKGIKLRLF